MSVYNQDYLLNVIKHFSVRSGALAGVAVMQDQLFNLRNHLSATDGSNDQNTRGQLIRSILKAIDEKDEMLRNLKRVLERCSNANIPNRATRSEISTALITFSRAVTEARAAITQGEPDAAIDNAKLVLARISANAHAFGVNVRDAR